MSRQQPHLLLTLCALLAVPAFGEPSRVAAQDIQQTGVQWQHDIESAKATARQTGKLVLVHFWTRSCGPCLMLDQNVFNQPGVAGAIESQFVPVKLNADENPATATGFGITRVPTDVILTADGQVVGKLISPPTPAAYVAEVSQIAAQHMTKGGLAFARAAESAPLPTQLNAAYANLQIAPNTPPALEAQQAATSNDRYAIPPIIAGSSLGAPAPGFAGGAQTVQNGSYGAWTQPPAIYGPSTAPTIPQPQAAAVPSVDDPYAPAPAGPISAPSPASPVQTVNPYAAVTPQPSAQTVNPYASATLVPAAPTTAPVLPSTAAAPVQHATPTIAMPPTATPNAKQPAADPPAVGFDGYCPVSMRNHWKWVPGDPRWGIVHRGRTYYFAGQDEQQQFWADPDRFSPALSGMDPVLAIDHKQQVPGKREHSIDYDNLFYMFASEATLQQFTANPERYATSVRQAMGIQRGRLVR